MPIQVLFSIHGRRIPIHNVLGLKLIPSAIIAYIQVVCLCPANLCLTINEKGIVIYPVLYFLYSL